jgi:hypothetical protein
MPGKYKVARYFTTIESFEAKSNKKTGGEEGFKFQVSGSRQQQAADPPISPMRPIGPISSYRSYPLFVVPVASCSLLISLKAGEGSGLAPAFSLKESFPEVLRS